MAQYEGRLDDAESEYERLLDDPPNVDKRRWLEVNLGHLAVERGDEETAKRRFAAVYADDRVDEHGANALYAVAKLAPKEHAVEARLAVMKRYPNQVAAEFALQEIVGLHRADKQFEALESLLAGMCVTLADSALGDNLWFERALVLHTELNEPDAALDAYRELFARYPKGPLADDALWEMASIYREHQLWEPAIVLLTRIADDVETSWFVGSYDSDWVDDAIYDVAWIKLVYQSDYDGAARWFRRYLKAYPDGILSDDAAWNLVEAHRLRGDEPGYWAAMTRFLTDYPESRYARRASARLEERS